MTTIGADMPEYNRRRTDAKIDGLMAAIDSMCETMLSAHVIEKHPEMDADEINTMIEDRAEKLSTLECVVDKIIEMLEGKDVRSKLTGEVVSHEEGMAQKLDLVLAHTAIVEERTNGGVTVTQRITPDLTKRQKGYVWGFAGTIVASLITSMAAIVAVLIG